MIRRLKCPACRLTATATLIRIGPLSGCDSRDSAAENWVVGRYVCPNQDRVPDSDVLSAVLRPER